MSSLSLSTTPCGCTITVRPAVANSWSCAYFSLHPYMGLWHNYWLQYVVKISSSCPDYEGPFAVHVSHKGNPTMLAKWPADEALLCVLSHDNQLRRIKLVILLFNWFFHLRKTSFSGDRIISVGTVLVVAMQIFSTVHYYVLYFLSPFQHKRLAHQVQTASLDRFC